MASDGHVGQQFSRDPILAYEYPHEGVTLCPSCHKQDGDATGVARRRSHYDVYDIASCTGGCGRTIKGSRHT